MREELIEGGVSTEARSAHMSHIYENLSLTFQELVEIFTIATRGFPNIEVTEKLDGQNIAISYDPQRKKSLALRNKGHVKKGGLDSQQIVSFFTADREAKAYDRLIKQGVPEDEARLQAKGARLDLKYNSNTKEVEPDPEGAGVVDAFRDAMQNFEEVAETFPEHFFITPEGCRIFYNAEVLDPRSRNVVDYDTQTLALHRTGHLVICPDSDKAQSVGNAAELSQKLQDVISMMQTQTHSAERDNMPTVEFNAVMDLTKHVTSVLKSGEEIEEPKILTKAKKALQRVMNSAGMRFDNTLHDFLVKRIESSEQLSYWVPELNESPELRRAFVDSIVFFATTGKTPRINTEVKNVLQHTGEREQLQQDIRLVLRDPKTLKTLIKKAYGPIEHIVHVFSTGLLEGLESYYTISGSYERNVFNLRAKYGGHVRGIMDSKSTKNIDAIKTHIQKILHQEEAIEELTDDHVMRSIQGLTSAVEGLVFDYNGHTYKLTGQFAPMNQILGIGRFDRGEGKRDDLGEFYEVLDSPERPTVGASSGERLIAIWPGGFKPPHAGHFYGAMELINKIEKENKQRISKMYILIGSAPRAGHGVDRTIRVTPEVSKRIWDLYFEQDPNNIVEVIALNMSPIKWIYDNLENNTFKDGDVLFLGHGEKDSPKRFAGIERHAKKHGLDLGVEIRTVPSMAGGVSGSEMRAMAASEVDFSVLERFMPSHISEDSKRQVYQCMVDPRSCAKTTMSESVSHILSLIDEAVSKHKGFQKRLKRRLLKQHKKLLDQGRKDLVKYGKPFTLPRPKKKSNAFLAKEGLKIRIPGVYDDAGQIHHVIEDPDSIPPEGMPERVLTSPCGTKEETEVVDEVSAGAAAAGFAGPFMAEED